MSAALGLPTDLDGLTPAERDEFLRLLEREVTLASPANFATRLSRGLWLPYRHLVHVSDRIVAMLEQDACDLILVELPVRHGKTELCSRWTPAWFICKTGKRVLLASYEGDFAATHGRKAREIVSEYGPRFGVHIDDTSRAAHRWDTVDGQGGMGTAGAGGPLIGKGGNLLIVDDPIRNVEDAQSAVMREKLWDWWQSVFMTRREPGGKALVIMSRWHEDDLIARLLAHNTGMRIERIRLPAIAEDDDPLGRRPGDALCPERYNEADLADFRADVGPNAWAAMYQQRPIPLGGGMFRRNAFNHWTSQTINGDTYYQLGDRIVPDEECWRFAMMDPAYSTRSKRSDYTACAVFAVAPGDPPQLMLLDMRRVRVEHAEHAPLIREVWDTWQPAWVGIEKQMATLSLFTDAQRNGVVVRWVLPDRNKIARAETAVALADAGRIWLPRNAVWLTDFLDEVVSFPVAAHDDQVDVLSYAAIEMTRQTVRPRHIRRQPETRDERCWAQIKRNERKGHLHPVLGRF